MSIDATGQDVGVESLESFFKRAPRLAVAFSGGSDSSYLLASAQQAGCQVKAYIARTAFQPASEMDDALRFVRELGVDFELIDIDILSHGDICANPPDRCYLCKTLIFSTIYQHMAHDGYDLLVDGTNATDNPQGRPGFRALAELKVLSPLRRAGMSKDDIRAAGRALNLFTADKPSFSCLAVHVPPETPLTLKALDSVYQSF